jgi:hypothetical protein
VKLLLRQMAAGNGGRYDNKYTVIFFFLLPARLFPSPAVCSRFCISFLSRRRDLPSALPEIHQLQPRSGLLSRSLAIPPSPSPSPPPPPCRSHQLRFNSTCHARLFPRPQIR